MRWRARVSGKVAGQPRARTFYAYAKGPPPFPLARVVPGTTFGAPEPPTRSTTEGRKDEASTGLAACAFEVSGRRRNVPLVNPWCLPHFDQRRAALLPKARKSPPPTRVRSSASRKTWHGRGSFSVMRGRAAFFPWAAAYQRRDAACLTATTHRGEAFKRTDRQQSPGRSFGRALGGTCHGYQSAKTGAAGPFQ